MYSFYTIYLFDLANYPPIITDLYMPIRQAFKPNAINILIAHLPNLSINQFSSLHRQLC